MYRRGFQLHTYIYFGASESSLQAPIIFGLTIPDSPIKVFDVRAMSFYESITQIGFTNKRNAEILHEGSVGHVSCLLY